MLWIVVVLFGVALAVIALWMSRELRPAHVLWTVGLGIAGALIGAVAARSIRVSETVNAFGLGIAALAGAIVLLAMQRSFAPRRRGV